MSAFIGLNHSNFHEGLLFLQCLGSAGLVNQGGLPLPSHETKLGQVTDAGLSLLYSQGDHSKYHRCSEQTVKLFLDSSCRGFLRGASGKEHTCQCWRHKRCRFDPGGSGRSPGGGHGSPLQYSCLKNPMDRGTWWATVHGVANKSCKYIKHSH